MEEENIRQVIYSEEFDAFYSGLDSKIQDKFDYGLRLIKTQYVVNLKSATLLKSQSVAAQTAKNAIFLVWTDFLPCVG